MTTPKAAATRRRRLSREERRRELLDAAAALVAERGAQGLTMEGLAARAGVSKGLGYAYFDDAEDVGMCLWDREVDEVYRRIEQASGRADSLEAALSAAVGTYFDIVTERGALLGELQARYGGNGRGGLSERVRDFLGFWVRKIRETYPVAPGPAWTMAGMLVTSVEVAGRTWGAGVVSRQRAEAVCIAFLQAGLRAGADADA